mmetsp:Transcript_23018/g.34107  ORF Transcript_23018/g.34107 Transcript_23018/m.34107 type:complete len:181 (+) Transcript_23018:119-661(+)
MRSSFITVVLLKWMLLDCIMLRLVRTVRADTAGGGDGDGNGPLYGDGGHNHHHGRDKQGGREDVFGIGAHHPNLTHKYPPRSQLSRPNRDLVSASVSNEKLADIDADADADERQRCVHVVKAAISITLADLLTALLAVTNILIIYLLYLLLVITIFLYAIILNPTKSKFLFLLIYDLLLF